MWNFPPGGETYKGHVLGGETYLRDFEWLQVVFWSEDESYIDEC